MFLNDIVDPMTAEEVKKSPVKSTVKEDGPWGSGEGYTGDLFHGTGDAWHGEGGGSTTAIPAGIGESAVGTMTFKEWAEAQGDLYKNFKHDSQTYARAKRAYLAAKQTTAETSMANPNDTESPIHGEDATSEFVQGPGVDDSQSPIHGTGNVQEADEDAKDLYTTTNDASTKDTINRGGRIIGHGKSTNAKLAAALSRSLDDLEQEKEKNQDQEKAIQDLDTVVARLGKDVGLDTAPADTGATPISTPAPAPSAPASVARPGMAASNAPTMPTPPTPAAMPGTAAGTTNVISMPSMSSVPATSKATVKAQPTAKQPAVQPAVVPPAVGQTTAQPTTQQPADTNVQAPAATTDKSVDTIAQDLGKKYGNWSANMPRTTPSTGPKKGGVSVLKPRGADAKAARLSASLGGVSNIANGATLHENIVETDSGLIAFAQSNLQKLTNAYIANHPTVEIDGMGGVRPLIIKRKHIRGLVDILDAMPDSENKRTLMINLFTNPAYLGQFVYEYIVNKGENTPEVDPNQGVLEGEVVPFADNQLINQAYADALEFLKYAYAKPNDPMVTTMRQDFAHKYQQRFQIAPTPAGQDHTYDLVDKKLSKKWALPDSDFKGLEEGQHLAVYHDGDQVELAPEYADRPGEVYTVSQSDQERGRCWIGDADGRGWYATFDQLIPAETMGDHEHDDDEAMDEGRMNALAADGQAVPAVAGTYTVCKSKDGSWIAIQPHDSKASAERHAQNIKNKYPGMQIAVQDPSGNYTEIGVKKPSAASKPSQAYNNGAADRWYHRQLRNDYAKGTKDYQDYIDGYSGRRFSKEAVAEDGEGTPEGLPHLTRELLSHIVDQVGTEGAHAIIKSLEWGDGAAEELLALILKDLKQDITDKEIDECLGRMREAKKNSHGHTPSQQAAIAMTKQGVAEEKADQVVKIFKDKSGKPIGEIGIDGEASPGNGNWYVAYHVTGYDAGGFDSYKEALDEFKAIAQEDGFKFYESQGVAEGHADQVKRVVKQGGKPVGEIGIDRESSPGNGPWYVKHYASGYDVVGFDSPEEALEELKHCVKQGVAEEWSQKYKKSINCSHPKGFSQKAHCAGKRKHNESVSESNNYWSKLQAERNTKLNTLVNKLSDSIKDIK
jgi:hypothetical protein